MPQQTDSAKRTRICQITTQLTGRKLRIAGRLLTYDVESGLAVILDGSYGILVDITLILDTRSNDWAHERLSMVMVIGHLEESDDPLRCHMRRPQSVVYKISQHLILRAILLVPSPDLDLGLWHAVLMEEEEERNHNKENSSPPITGKLLEFPSYP